MSAITNIGRSTLGFVGRHSNHRRTQWPGPCASGTGTLKCIRGCPPRQLGKGQISRVTNMTPILKKSFKVPNIAVPKPKQRQFMPPMNAVTSVKHVHKKKDVLDWLKENSGAMILNFGSVCLLLAFTRKDIVELRALAMTGSLTNVIYFGTRAPVNYLPMTWSTIFVMTNVTMLYWILDERNGSVHLSENQLRLYEEHFLPHGVTPKQFEKVLNKATRIEVPNDTIIQKQGVPIDTVTLLYKGATQAMSTARRRITAASSEPTLANNMLLGRNAGAWIGEIHFLEVLAAKETGRVSKEQKKEHDGRLVSPRPTILSYRTTQDSTLLQWSFDDLAELLDSGADMRSNMTRAMTAAVVGKVVNYTVEKNNKAPARPNWMSWLTAGQTFQHSYGNDGVTLEEKNLAIEDDEDELVVDEQGKDYDGPPLHQLVM